MFVYAILKLPLEATLNYIEYYAVLKLTIQFLLKIK